MAANPDPAGSTRSRLPGRIALVVSSAAVLAAVVSVSPPAAVAAAPCVVTNTATRSGPTFSSIMDAIQDELDVEKHLQLRFTGTCVESVYLGRTGKTTIVGRATRATGVPTLDATGANASAITVYGGPVVLRGFTVTGGTGASGGPSRSGGGLYIDSTPVTLTDMRITRNTVSGTGARGAGIWMSGALGPAVPGLLARLTIGGRTVIDDNNSEEYGGGIHVEAGATVRIVDRVRVERNHAGHSGGGISVSVGEGLASATLFVGGRAVVADNDADIGGGGIFTSGEVFVTVDKSAAVRTNTAVLAGGGMSIFGGVVDLGGTVYGNTANGGLGGGLAAFESTVKVTRTARITANEADEGGGIAASDSSLTISGSSISGNRATLGNGGGVNLFNPLAFSMRGGRISGNRAVRDGGGMFVSTTPVDMTVRLDGVKVEGNLAGYDKSGSSLPVFGEKWDGGGISALLASIELTGGTSVSNNRNLNGDGGGVHAVDSVVTIRKSVLDRNAAGYAGGAVHLTRGTLQFSGSTKFRRNTATEEGGAVATKGAVTISESPGTKISLEKNSAGESGGALYIEYSARPVDLFGLTLRDNRAGEQGGGLFASSAASVTVRDSSFVGNRSLDGNGGGALIQTNASVLVERVSFRNNQTATGEKGGGLYVAGKRGVTVAELRSVRVTGNRSGAGGGIGAEFASVLLTGGSRVSGNKALDGYGGGMHLNFTGPFAGGCSSITGNRSAYSRDSDAVYHIDDLVNLGSPVTNYPCKR